MLAGLLKAPSNYAPTNNLKRAQDRAAVIIGLMEEQGYLTPAEADDALRPSGRAVRGRAAQSAGGYFADWVMETRAVLPGPRNHRGRDHQHHAGPAPAEGGRRGAGLRSLTTRCKAGSKAQAAIVVMSADGAVRAMVGGRKIAQAGSFNRATQALRQTGSSFKPFVYAAALDLGWSPMDFVDDSPLTINIPGSGPWTPRELRPRIQGPDHPDPGAGRKPQHPRRASVTKPWAASWCARSPTDFGIAVDLAAGPALALGRVGGDADRDDRRLCRHPERRLVGDALRADRTAAARIEDDPLIGAGGGIGERVISENAAQAADLDDDQGRRKRHRQRGRGWTTARSRARPAPPPRRATPGSSALPPIMSPASGWAMTTTPR